MNILILNGGQSLRMNGETKCLSFVDGKTIFEHELQWIKQNLTVFNILISIGNNKNLESYFDNFNIDWFAESKPLGDGGAIKNGFNEFQRLGMDNKFLFAMNGDTIPLFDLQKFIVQGVRRLSENEHLYGIIVANSFRSHLGIMECDTSDRFGEIKSFKEKPVFDNFYSSCGMYLLNQKVSKILPDNGSFAKEVIEKYTSHFETYIISNDYWIAIESLKDAIKAEQIIKNIYKMRS